MKMLLLGEGGHRLGIRVHTDKGSQSESSTVACTRVGTYRENNERTGTMNYPPRSVVLDV